MEREGLDEMIPYYKAFVVGRQNPIVQGNYFTKFHLIRIEIRHHNEQWANDSPIQTWF